MCFEQISELEGKDCILFPNSFVSYFLTRYASAGSKLQFTATLHNGVEVICSCDGSSLWP